MDQAAFDREARVEAWLKPGERIWWRGRPENRIRFTGRDVLLSLFALVWAAFGTVITLQPTPHHLGAFGAAFIAIGAYLAVGRLVAAAWQRRHSWYLVTSERAVDVATRGRVRSEAPAGAPATVELQRDGRHGTVLFEVPPERLGRLHLLFGANTFGGMLRGTGWPGARWWAAGEVAFLDLDDVAAAVDELRRLGIAVTTQSARLALPAAPRPGAGLAARGRHWLHTRFGRVPYFLASPLSPEEAIRRLDANLAPVRALSFLSRPWQPYRGTVSGWSVELRYESGSRNSGNVVFQGGILAGPGGCGLSGTIGPSPILPVFSIIWFGGVTLFLAGGIVGLVAGLFTGHASSAVPFVLIPAFMLGFFVILVEAMHRIGWASWAKMDRWLRELLEVPPGASRSTG